MKLDRQKYKTLALFLVNTKPEEMTCSEWLDQVGEYADHVLDGGPAPKCFAAIKRHLELCPECGEEFCAILAALRIEE